MAAEKKVPGQNFLRYDIFVDGMPLPDGMLGQVMTLLVDELPMVIEFRSEIQAAAEKKNSNKDD